MDLQQFNQYQQLHDNKAKEIESKINTFKKQIDRINNSDNPYYRDSAGVRDYEIKQHRQALEKEVSELMSDYQAQLEQAEQQAEKEAALSFFKPGDTDKRQAQAALSDFTSEALLAYNDKQKAEAFGKLEKRLGYMGENELAAVKEQLPDAISKVQGDEEALRSLKRVNNTLSHLKTEEKEALDSIKSLKASRPDSSFRRLQLVSRHFSDEPNNRSDKGMAHVVPLSEQAEG